MQNVVLERFASTETLLDYFAERHAIENEFQKWALENPEDPEFDRKLRKLFAQE